MAVLLHNSPLFRRVVVSDVKEPSNGFVDSNVEKCLRHSRTGPSCHSDKKGPSPIDAALTALYHEAEMSPDSQLGSTTPDSQLEANPPESHGPVQQRTSPHMTAQCSLPPEIVGECPTFSDTSGKPADTLMYGYYLPHKDLMVGNRGHALSARFIWKRRFKGLKSQPLDGVACWTLPGGVTVVRTVVRDFFTGKYLVLDRFPKYGPLSGATE